jgi:hypothetical protein
MDFHFRFLSGGRPTSTDPPWFVNLMAFPKAITDLIQAPRIGVNSWQRWGQVAQSNTFFLSQGR